MKRFTIAMTGLTIIFMLLVFAVIVNAEPTPADRSLIWDEYTDPSGIGFFLYWAPEAENPRAYSNARRTDIGFPSTSEITAEVDGTTRTRHSVVVIDANPAASASLCIKLTAYDAIGRESVFSGEACGWFGLPTALGVAAQ